ncbi:MAG: hypothetical protein ACC707_17555, partial [Thiohalomonadales bacterium]
MNLYKNFNLNHIAVSRALRTSLFTLCSLLIFVIANPVLASNHELTIRIIENDDFDTATELSLPPRGSRRILTGAIVNPKTTDAQSSSPDHDRKDGEGDVHEDEGVVHPDHAGREDQDTHDDAKDSREDADDLKNDLKDAKDDKEDVREAAKDAREAAKAALEDAKDEQDDAIVDVKVDASDAIEEPGAP